VLTSVYEQTLEALSKFPKQWAYTGHLQALTSHRLAVVQRETEVERIEAAIDSGMIEELVRQVCAGACVRLAGSRGSCARARAPP
jgi:hypothetical protein